MRSDRLWSVVGLLRRAEKNVTQFHDSSSLVRPRPARNTATQVPGPSSPGVGPVVQLGRTRAGSCSRVPASELAGTCLDTLWKPLREYGTVSAEPTTPPT